MTMTFQVLTLCRMKFLANMPQRPTRTNSGTQKMDAARFSETIKLILHGVRNQNAIIWAPHAVKTKKKNSTSKMLHLEHGFVWC